MFLNAFVQPNDASSTWLTNIRNRFIYRPLSDFYLVYKVALKHTLLLAF